MFKLFAPRHAALAFVGVVMFAIGVISVVNWALSLDPAKSAWGLLGDALAVAAAAGIYFRSKPAYWFALCLTIVNGVSAAAPLAALPLFAMLLTPDMADVVSWLIFVGPILVLAALLFVLWRMWTGIADSLRSLSLRWGSLITTLAIVGATELIFFDAVFRADKAQAWIVAMEPFTPTLIVMWIAWFLIMSIPVVVYVLWSYGVLRSRETRDYFGLP